MLRCESLFQITYSSAGSLFRIEISLQVPRSFLFADFEMSVVERREKELFEKPVNDEDTSTHFLLSILRRTLSNGRRNPMYSTIKEL